MTPLAAPPSPGATLVVAAFSARVLAESARQAGWRVISLDLFGDADTQRASARWLPIGSPAAMRIEAAALRAALAEATAEPGVFGWVAGSGFEADTTLLDLAPPSLPRLGLASADVRRVRDPALFFATLQRLGLPFPDTRFDGPAPGAGWLLKQCGGSGGWHIREAAPGQRPGPGDYLQQRHAGEPMSALFLADGHSARRVALNRLLVPSLAGRPFVYQGAIGPLHDKTIAAALDDALARLVPVFQLRGLASLDFLWHDGRAVLLEINPRPSASMVLHGEAWPRGLMQAHVAACFGHLPADEPRTAPETRGEAIVYADARLTVGPALAQALAELTHCHDLPQPGVQIGLGEPLCSVSAHGSGAEAMASALGLLQQQVLALARATAEPSSPRVS